MAMFGLFKKKEKNEEKKPLSAHAEEMRAFAAQFLNEEMDILAVTGAGGFGGGKVDGDELMTVGTGLTAWMQEDSAEIHRGNFRLVTKADETLVGYLQSRLPRDFIIKCKVRPNAGGDLFMLVGLPEPGFDPDLKAILLEQKKPVTVEIDGLGAFTLNRGMGVLQQQIDWLGYEVQLCMDQEADRAACARTALVLLEDKAGWDEKARALAVNKLLAKANELAAEAGAEELTREEFLEGLEPESIDVSEDGAFQLWFNDGGYLLGGHFVRVSGSVNEGVTDAAMEG